MNLYNSFGTSMSFVDYNDYLARIQFLDRFNFQPKVRRQNTKNL